MQQFSPVEPEWKEERATLKSRFLRTVRVLAILTSLGLTLYWALFTLDHFLGLWLAPAAFAVEVRAGFTMCMVSVASTFIATGLLARTWVGWSLSVFLLACMAVASVGLYSQLDAMPASPFCIPAQLAGVAVIVIGVAVFPSPSDWKND
jgi:hypothetical protein